MKYKEFLSTMRYTSVRNMTAGQKELLESLGHDLEPSYDPHVVGAYWFLNDEDYGIHAVRICEPNPRDGDEYEFVQATIERSIFEGPLEKQDPIFRKIYEFCKQEGICEL